MNRYERFYRIITEVNKGRYPSVQDFCNKFEIADRTFYADLKYLREFMELEIEYDDTRGGYFNANPNKQLPKFPLTQGELLALTVGKDMLSEYSGTIFESMLVSALDKIEERLPEPVKVDLPNLVSAVRFKTTGVIPVSRSMFFDLNKACDGQTLVSLQYASASSRQTTIREVEPMRLVENRGAWYLIGWCKLKNALRMFALHRILEYKLLNDKFGDRGVDVDAYIGDAFLLEHGDPSQQYVIRFSASAAPYVCERNWHSSQNLERHADGSCTLSFKATNLDEVKRWVLVYGADAEVLEPKALRLKLRDELACAAANYADIKVLHSDSAIAAKEVRKPRPKASKHNPKPDDATE